MFSVLPEQPLLTLESSEEHFKTLTPGHNPRETHFNSLSWRLGF